MALKIDIYTKDLELTSQFRNYVNKKVGRLERFLNEIDECRVDLAHAKSARNLADRNICSSYYPWQRLHLRVRKNGLKPYSLPLMLR